MNDWNEENFDFDAEFSNNNSEEMDDILQDLGGSSLLGTRRRVSSFSFDLHAIPLSLSINKISDEEALGKSISLFSAITLIIGMCIGSGIFSSPGPVLLYSSSVGLALFIWFVAGILAITGALCYAELGTMIPTSGGEHPYLKRAYGYDKR